MWQIHSKSNQDRLELIFTSEFLKFLLISKAPSVIFFLQLCCADRRQSRLAMNTSTLISMTHAKFPERKQSRERSCKCVEVSESRKQRIVYFQNSLKIYSIMLGVGSMSCFFPFRSEKTRLIRFLGSGKCVKKGLNGEEGSFIMHHYSQLEYVPKWTWFGFMPKSRVEEGLAGMHSWCFEMKNCKVRRCNLEASVKLEKTSHSFAFKTVSNFGLTSTTFLQIAPLRFIAVCH